MSWMDEAERKRKEKAQDWQDFKKDYEQSSITSRINDSPIFVGMLKDIAITWGAIEALKPKSWWKFWEEEKHKRFYLIRIREFQDSTSIYLYLWYGIENINMDSISNILRKNSNDKFESGGVSITIKDDYLVGFLSYANNDGIHHWPSSGSVKRLFKIDDVRNHLSNGWVEGWIVKESSYIQEAKD